MVASRWEGSENLAEEKVLMSVAEANVSLATDLPKYQLLFTIKGIGAVARDFIHPHSPSPEMRL
jgi:hypothetical protein